MFKRQIFYVWILDCGPEWFWFSLRHSTCYSFTLICPTSHFCPPWTYQLNGPLQSRWPMFKWPCRPTFYKGLVSATSLKISNVISMFLVRTNSLNRIAEEPWSDKRRIRPIGSIFSRKLAESWGIVSEIAGLRHSTRSTNRHKPWLWHTKLCFQLVHIESMGDRNRSYRPRGKPVTTAKSFLTHTIITMPFLLLSLSVHIDIDPVHWFFKTLLLPLDPIQLDYNLVSSKGPLNE